MSKMLRLLNRHSSRLRIIRDFLISMRLSRPISRLRSRIMHCSIMLICWLRRLMVCRRILEIWTSKLIITRLFKTKMKQKESTYCNLRGRNWKISRVTFRQPKKNVRTPQTNSPQSVATCKKWLDYSKPPNSDQVFRQGKHTIRRQHLMRTISPIILPN